MRRLIIVFTLVLAACGGDVRDMDPHGSDGGTTARPDAAVGPARDRSLLFYYGPMKLMVAESILYSIEAFTGHDFGAWDFTAPEPGSAAFNTAGNGTGTFYRHCRILGGCMEHRIPLGRSSFVGTAYVLELERAAVEACNNRMALGMFPGGVRPGASVQAIDVIQDQYQRAFGALPSDADRDASLAYFDGHLRAPELTDITPLESAARGHCRVLLTSNKYLFY